MVPQLKKRSIAKLLELFTFRILQRVSNGNLQLLSNGSAILVFFSILLQCCTLFCHSATLGTIAVIDSEFRSRNWEILSISPERTKGPKVGLMFFCLRVFAEYCRDTI